MTLSKKVNWTTALKAGVRHRTAKPATRAFHRRAVAAAPPAIQARPIRVDRTQLAELLDLVILTVAAVAGWIATAIVFGIV
jgi:hypothetical protein